MKTDKTSATKADIQLVLDTMAKLFAQSEERWMLRFGQMRKDMRMVVDVANRLDERLSTRIDSHEQRIRRLEDQVGVAV